MGRFSRKPKRHTGPVRFANSENQMYGEVIEYTLDEAELNKIRRERPTRTKDDFEKLIQLGNSENTIMEMWGWTYPQLIAFKKKYHIKRKYSSTR
ncbi:hypothetical protein ABE244_06035 [Bacillus toyonensis]|uniref:hypothetical protein n=1 Tax=Bacillus toyonensis TaxID=155322 RepID=UPI003D203F27